MLSCRNNSSAIRQKSKSQNGCFNKKTRQIFRKSNTSYPLIRTRTCAYVCMSGGKKCSFFGKFGVLCFLETTVLRFTLLPYYRQTKGFKTSKFNDKKGFNVYKLNSEKNKKDFGHVNLISQPNLFQYFCALPYIHLSPYSD